MSQATTKSTHVETLFSPFDMFGNLRPVTDDGITCDEFLDIPTMERCGELTEEQYKQMDVIMNEKEMDFSKKQDQATTTQTELRGNNPNQPDHVKDGLRQIPPSMPKPIPLSFPTISTVDQSEFLTSGNMTLESYINAQMQKILFGASKKIKQKKIPDTEMHRQRQSFKEKTKKIKDLVNLQIAQPPIPETTFSHPLSIPPTCVTVPSSTVLPSFSPLPRMVQESGQEIQKNPPEFDGKNRWISPRKLDRRAPTVTNVATLESTLQAIPGSIFVAVSRMRLIGLTKLQADWLEKTKNQNSRYVDIQIRLQYFMMEMLKLFDVEFKDYVQQSGFENMAYLRKKPEGKRKRTTTNVVPETSKKIIEQNSVDTNVETKNGKQNVRKITRKQKIQNSKIQQLEEAQIRENPDQKTQIREVQIQENADQEVQIQENADQEVQIQENADQEVQIQENADQEVQIQENPDQEVQIQENPDQEVQIQENPVQENPVQENPDQEGRNKNVKTEGISYRKFSYRELRTQDFQDQKTPNQDQENQARETADREELTIPETTTRENQSNPTFVQQTIEPPKKKIRVGKSPSPVSKRLPDFIGTKSVET